MENWWPPMVGNRVFRVRLVGLDYKALTESTTRVYGKAIELLKTSRSLEPPVTISLRNNHGRILWTLTKQGFDNLDLATEKRGAAEFMVAEDGRGRRVCARIEFEDE
jgi:hypothetical protein